MTSALGMCTRHRRILVKCPNERGRDIWVREAQAFLYEQEAPPHEVGVKLCTVVHLKGVKENAKSHRAKWLLLLLNVITS